MIAVISKWGNSQGLRFPKDVMKALELSVGDKVKITTQDHKMIIEPLKEQKKKYDINDLVRQMPQNYKPEEVLSDSVGNEAW
jgi:antitoxin MazE